MADRKEREVMLVLGGVSVTCVDIKVVYEELSSDCILFVISCDESNRLLLVP